MSENVRPWNRSLGLRNWIDIHAFVTDSLLLVDSGVLAQQTTSRQLTCVRV